MSRAATSSIPDAIVVGAGPGGLTAALYLARFHRKVLVIDGGESRARWIPTSHNIPGFTQGIGGTDLLSQLRAQAMRYGAQIVEDRVSAISAHEGRFELTIESKVIVTPFVILATGVKDRFPPLPGVEEAVLRSVLRFCPVCDGFEATGQRIAVIGDGEVGAREAQFLFQTYSRDVSYLHLGKGDPPSKNALAALGIKIRTINLHDLRIDGKSLWLDSANGPAEKYDVLYAALGCEPQHELAQSLGAALDEQGRLKVNSHQQTSV